ncbi:D-ribose pyranase [Pokkaliibacter plantistimulans]|uniref:D-ribose pyranase n=1 Tax=Pokkaliibacter plantistimulans TaxID=1635171 RepID=A0ABX5M0B8_9GAMM|nr:D-ribose pyranase [Pokkaliibacter plantistimulans]PXF30883.1 D-ribose pyranase [Pokkaliibacter plantistimulans]
MRLGPLLNQPLSAYLSMLGHTDEITLGDAGLPIPAQVERIDLALKRGVPGLLDTLEVVLAEVAVEAVTLAQELPSVSPYMHQAMLTLVSAAGQRRGIDIAIHYVSHSDFKVQSGRSRAVVRTGECTPYANIILHAGVAFEGGQ